MADDDLTMGLVVRLAEVDDIPAIEALDRLSTSPFREIHQDLQKYFGSLDPSMHERNLIFLALADAALVGKAELVLAPASVASRVGYIKRVVVHPDYRGHGIARRLMRAVIAFSREEQISFLDLHVFEQNLPAIRLYESLGFEEEHREVYYRLRLKGEQSHKE
jgi:ribosomal protein S18 acetylase RimI-like enzyme